MKAIHDKGKKETCRGVFEALYHEVDLALTNEEKERIQFSTVIMEHAMCKYYKAVTHNLF